MNQHDKILTFTTHKARLPLIDDIFRNHVEVAEALKIGISISLQDDSIPYLTKYQKSLIDSGKVELLHIQKDHGSNTKWTLCRMVHPEATLIVVDDDWLYDAEGLRSLLETHKRFPEAVICRAYREIPWCGDRMPQYEVKPSYTYPKIVTAHILVNQIKDAVSNEERILEHGRVFPEHFLGVLYPPSFPKFDPYKIPQECMKDDDVFVGGLVSAERRNLIFAGRETISSDRDMDMPSALWAESRAENGYRTFVALKTMEDAYQQGVKDIGLGQVMLLTCSKYPLRRDSVKGELNRLGISYVEQYDDGSIKPEIGFRHKHINRCHLAKYLALTKALETSAPRITIIEDDVRFLKDIKEVSQAIKSMPKGFGACRLSWGVSPYIRNEMLSKCPKRVVAIEKEMSTQENHWVRCPWASTDGCTVMTREVAETFHAALEKMIEGTEETLCDNSDDILCRICESLGMPMFAYKPLICIQVNQDDVEVGKSDVAKFFVPEKYYVRGIVRPLDSFSNTKEIKWQKQKPQQISSEIHFSGYRLGSRKVIPIIPRAANW